MRKFILSLVALLSIGLTYSFANYTMTQGAGTTFGSTLVGGVHYVQMFICDLTTPGQCASVSAGGAVKVDGSGATQPVSGTVTANAGTNLNTSALALETGGNLATTATNTGTSNTNLGAPGSTACATDNGSCNLNALLQRNNQRATSVITALGSPFQAGGSIGNTSFGISGTLPAYASTPTFNVGTAGSISTSANQTNGTQKSQIVDGSGNVIGSTSNALNVAITSGGGSGGTASSFGATFPATGTAAGMSQGGNMVALTGTSGNLNVNVASAVGAAQGSTTSGQTGSLIMGAVTTSAPTYTTAQTSPISLDTAGNVRVNPGTVTVTATNLSVNNAQINGVTPLMGNGVTGTGSQRVTVASDSAARAVAGEGATGSAVPSGAQLTGVRSGANMVAMIQASASAAISVSTATTTQLVALSSGQLIYVTSFDVIAGGTGNITFVYGTGTNCGTGTTSLTGAYNLTAQAGIAKGSGIGPVLVVPSGNALCVTTSAAVQMSGSVSYTQF